MALPSLESKQNPLEDIPNAIREEGFAKNAFYPPCVERGKESLSQPLIERCPP